MESHANLQAYSFGIAYKHLTVKEVQRRCRELAAAESICENVDNWKAYIIERYGFKYVAERGDLQTADDWIDFARGMELGYTFRYTAYIEFDRDLGNLVEGTHDGNDSLFGHDAYDQPTNFKIEGTFIRPGPTIHYSGKIVTFVNRLLPDQGDDDRKMNFVSRIFSSPALVAEWVAQYLTLNVFNDERIPRLKATEVHVRINDQFDDDRRIKKLVRTTDPLAVIVAYANPKSNTDYDKNHEFELYFKGMNKPRVIVVWYPIVKIDI